MTTTIKVTSHNYPALVQTFDKVWDAEKKVLTNDLVLTHEIVLKPEDGEQFYHCTTSREIRVTDLEYDDPRVAAKS